MTQATELIGFPTFKAGEDLKADCNVKLKSGTVTIPPEVVYVDAGEVGIGFTRNNVLDGESIAVRPYTSPGEFLITMAGNCSIADSLYAANDGKFSTTPAGTMIFKALLANTGGDGAKITAILEPVISTTAGAVTYDNAGGETAETTAQGAIKEIYDHIIS